MILRALSSVLLAAVQVLCTLGPANPPYNAYSDQRPSGDAMQLAGQVNGALVEACRPNCPTVAMFRNPTAPNATVILDTPGRAKIVYKPEFFMSVYDTYGDGAILALMAHEVGHAIDASSPASWMKATWTAELRADAWAGCALAKMNLSANAMKASLAALAKYPPVSQTDWAVRVEVLKAGYTHCMGTKWEQ